MGQLPEEAGAPIANRVDVIGSGRVLRRTLVNDLEESKANAASRAGLRHGQRAGDQPRQELRDTFARQLAAAG